MIEKQFLLQSKIQRMKIRRSKTVTAYLFGAAFIGILFASCNNTKYIPDNDALYTGATIKLKNSTVGSKQNSAIKASLAGLVRPKPNSKILGMRVKLSIYNFAGKPNPKGKKGPGSLIRKYGEPPVLLSSLNLDRNVQVLTSNLQNRGFFHAVVTGDTTVKNKKASATYEVETGAQYTINDVLFPQDSSAISTAIRGIAPKTILKKDAPYNLDGIKGERTRIDIALKEQGFYFFSPDELIARVDSTIGNNKVNIYMDFKPGIPMANRQQYRINDVYIYSNYRLNTARQDTLKSDSVKYAGYYVIDRNKTFNPKVFERVMVFEPGDLYNRTDHNLSLSRLINLGTFKFVKNRFEVLPDSFKLDAYYYLTPLQKKSLSVEIGGSTKQPSNATGSDITVGWRNRNAFKGAELVTVSAYVGSEVQVSGQYGGNTFRTGAEANISFPRFVIPLFDWNTSGSYVPRTRMQLGYDILSRPKYFTLNSYRGQLGYVWKESAQKEHQFNPIAINYVQPLNITQAYRDSISKNSLFGRATQQQFIIGSNYNFNYNQLVNKEKNAGGLYFNGLLDLSGNIAGLLTGANVKKGDTVSLFGSRFSQYVKTEFDTRYYIKVGLNNQWANRLIIGVGVPYGNSWQLPYSKQFVVGGSNSLRGFRARSVGPGIYKVGLKNSNGIRPDATGDLKLEMNTEFRAKLYSIFYGAFFVDAGNIWLYNNDTAQVGGKFTKDFLKELAVDAGVGLRIDLQILLLRLDVAFPVRDPSLIPPGQLRYISQSAYRKQNIVFNLAIGLPF
jgi:outer membrane protein insertion porin family